MEQKLDFEFLNFDRALGRLREAQTNFQNASVEFAPALRAYIKALKTLNAEMLGRLDPLLRGLDPSQVIQTLCGPCERQKGRGAAAHSQAAPDTVQGTSLPVSNGRGNRRISRASGAWVDPRTHAKSHRKS